MWQTHVVLQLHSSVIRDVTFLDSSWPWARGHQSVILSASGDGMCKVDIHPKFCSNWTLLERNDVQNRFPLSMAGCCTPSK